MYSPKELDSFKGIVFDLVYPKNGRRVQCYIAQLDIKVGMTCKCYKDSIINTKGKLDFKAGEDMICYNLGKSAMLEDMLACVEVIVTTGEYVYGTFGRVNTGFGYMSCGFN